MKANIARIGLAVVFVVVLAGIEIGGSNTPSTVHAQSTGLASTYVDHRHGRTLRGMAGTWQATLLGNTGCGLTSYLVTFTLDSFGNATDAAITGHYMNRGNGGGCLDGGTNSGNTFTISSLNSNGSGQAGLSCGSDCGWQFNIQVSRDSTEFNLVDVDPQNPDNLLQGVAVLQ